MTDVAAAAPERPSRAPEGVEPAPTPSEPKVWHALSVAAALSGLDASAAGLSATEARARLADYGPNALPSAPPRPAWRRFLAQFQNLLIYVLLASAAITAAIGHWVDSAVILAVVIGNAIVGYIQEGRAEKAMDSIRDMLAPKATVLRDGARSAISATELAPGDVVLLEAGDRTPADIRLFDVRGLQVEEAALTGESAPVVKTEEPAPAAAALGDRTSMAYSGTLITAGAARGVVVATGRATEIGRISGLISEVQELSSPLIRSIDAFAQTLTIAILGVCAAVFAFGWFARDYALGELFLAVVGIAVAAIPEGLPAVMTITLALGVQAMAARSAIARRLPAVETLGAVSVICTDKTGTLTKNEMTIVAVASRGARYQLSGAGYAPDGAVVAEAGADLGPARALLETAALASEGEIAERSGRWVALGDPMEGAIAAAAAKAGLDVSRLRAEQPRRAAIPFDSRRRFMATLIGEGAAARLAVKGAADRLIDHAAAERWADGDDRPVDADWWRGEMEAMAAEGRRVIAVAEARGPDDRPLAPSVLEAALRNGRDHEPLDGLVLLGLLALEDPPRPEAVDAVAECQAAGVRVKMITGDHASTARAIGARLGLSAERAVTGAELEAMDEAGFAEAARSVDIFARAAPETKLRLVEALQADGHVVAMTGDGVNDAPALKRADVGVAMGLKGADAAKEAGDVVLADDNFATIAAAVREGRRIFDNLKKCIFYMLPTNGGEGLVVLAAILLGVSLPISPVQILWINLVTTVTLALALVFDPEEKSVMDRPPRDAAEPILSRWLSIQIVLVSVLLMLGVMATHAWAVQTAASPEAARTMAAGALVAFEIAFLFNVRRGGVSVRAAPAVWIAIVAVVILQLLFTYWAPLQAVFGTADLTIQQLAVIVAAGALMWLAIQAELALATYLLRSRASA